jgi:hypothetical protein
MNTTKTIILSKNGRYYYTANLAVRKGNVYKAKDIKEVLKALGITVKTYMDQNSWSIQEYPSSAAAHQAMSKDLSF